MGKEVWGAKPRGRRGFEKLMIHYQASHDCELCS